MLIRRALADEVRRLLATGEWSHRQIAAKTGVGRTTIGKIAAQKWRPTDQCYQNQNMDPQPPVLGTGAAEHGKSSRPLADQTPSGPSRAEDRSVDRRTAPSGLAFSAVEQQHPTVQQQSHVVDEQHLDEEADFAPEDLPLPVRCRSCGGLVYPPCRLCKVRRYQQQRQQKLQQRHSGKTNPARSVNPSGTAGTSGYTGPSSSAGSAGRWRSERRGP